MVTSLNPSFGTIGLHTVLYVIFVTPKGTRKVKTVVAQSTEMEIE